MSLRCFFGWHLPGAIVGREISLHVRCMRCYRISPGVAIDGPRPTVTQPSKPKSRVWWLRAVYENTQSR